jgi:endonuclease/exonuclease/phosphatase family metal-dependent hydrolase
MSMHRLVLAVTAAAVVVAGGAVGVQPSPGGRKASDAGTPQPALKLLQFNILTGAIGGRAAGVVAVIKASGADVVTLNEASSEETFPEIAAATGFHSVYVRANDGYNIGILSRFPIRICQQFRQPPIRHAAYGCRITIRGTRWWIFGTHLWGWDEAVRMQEISVILKQMNNKRPAPVVLAGDLNTDTPGETGRRIGVVPMLREAEYVDAFRELHSFQSDPGFTVGVPPFGELKRRFDYVFRSKSARAVAARVISTVAGYQWPSDHAALFVKLVSTRKANANAGR